MSNCIVIRWWIDGAFCVQHRENMEAKNRKAIKDETDSWRGIFPQWKNLAVELSISGKKPFCLWRICVLLFVLPQIYSPFYYLSSALILRTPLRLSDSLRLVGIKRRKACMKRGSRKSYSNKKASWLHVFLALLHFWKNWNGIPLR